MRERLLDLIVCPLCKASFSLAVEEAHSGRIETGMLTCRQCGRCYAIRGGIPRLLVHVTDPRTADSFGFEWTQVEVTDVAEDVVTFFRKTGLDERIYEGLPAKEARYPRLEDLSFVPDGSGLSRKMILDAGCGMGRYLNVAKEYGCEVVGMDVSRSVERAGRLVNGHGRVHLVQGDLLMPPFRPGTFDYIYSIGVVHHTPRPAETFGVVASLCRPGGGMSVHVYPPGFWLDPIRGFVMKALRLVTVRLPHQILLAGCRRIALPLGMLQMRWSRSRVGKLLGAPLFLVTVPRHTKPGVIIGDTFDTYSARYIWTFTDDDVAGWFRAAGFEQVQAVPYPTTVKGRKRVDGAS